MSNPYQVIKDFERTICRYTGAPYAVAVNSCTNALLVTLSYWAWHLKKCGLGKQPIEVPCRTYVSVPMVVKHAGFDIKFTDKKWEGSYVLHPYPIIDSARHLTSCFYQPGTFKCLSFHWTKHLSLGHAGAIIHDDKEADIILRKLRFDGRTEQCPPNEDYFEHIGYHCMIDPKLAAEGILRLNNLPKHNDPLPNDDYPDLSQFEVFK